MLRMPDLLASDTDFPVRSAVTPGQLDRNGPPISETSGERPCAGCDDRELLWKTRERSWAALITRAPVLLAGRLMCLNGQAKRCLQRTLATPANSAQRHGCQCRLGIIWTSSTVPDAPKPTRKNEIGTTPLQASAAIWSSPRIHARKSMIYVTTGDNYSDPAARMSDELLSLDLETETSAAAADDVNIRCSSL
jgi:hypothetical protein